MRGRRKRDGIGLVGEMRKVEVEGDQFRDSTVNRIKIIRVEGKRVYI